MTDIQEIKLFDADSLEYAGSIMVNGHNWNFTNVTDEHLIQTATGMPLKAILACLISFNLVYDIIGSSADA